MAELPDIDKLPEIAAALRAQIQLDADGCMVGVSRQACDEAADIVDSVYIAALEVVGDEMIKSVVFDILPEDVEALAARSWTEDFDTENGNYGCKCVHCQKPFIGYKRRTCCKLCDEVATEQRMKDVPKDGSMLCLLVDYSEVEKPQPLDDAAQAWTIGYNTLKDTGDDEWIIVGWCWDQDCFVTGGGKVIDWRPFNPDVLKRG